MQQTPSSLNPWLLSYVLQRHKSRSRYEIDRYLIEAGYNPTQIEVTWQTVLSGSYQQELVDVEELIRRRYSKRNSITIMVVITSLILTCMLLAFLFTPAAGPP